MTTPEPRNMQTFIAICLDVMDDATTCGAELGMAFRAWIDDATLSDRDVAEKLRAACGAGAIETVEYGGSIWVRGVQLSMFGVDMAGEGVVMHLELDASGAEAARAD